MKCADDPTQTARSSNTDSSLRATRRDIIVTGTTGVGLLTTAGSSSASNHETSSDDESASETDPLTITVTGLEIDGPLKNCVVKYKNEQKTTDESGTVVFENGDGPYEVTAEKNGWQDKTETIKEEGNQREISLLMHVTDPLND